MTPTTQTASPLLPHKTSVVDGSVRLAGGREGRPHGRRRNRNFFATSWKLPPMLALGRQSVSSFQVQRGKGGVKKSLSEPVWQVVAKATKPKRRLPSLASLRAERVPEKKTGVLNAAALPFSPVRVTEPPHAVPDSQYSMQQLFVVRLCPTRPLLRRQLVFSST